MLGTQPCQVDRAKYPDRGLAFLFQLSDPLIANVVS